MHDAWMTATKSRYSSVLAAMLLLLSASANAGQVAGPIQCSNRWGAPGKPLVTSASTAKVIFLAIEHDFMPAADSTNFPDIGVEDEGRWWAVSRGRAPQETGNGDIIVTYGGGQLALRIGKCDGRISEIHFSR